MKLKQNTRPPRAFTLIELLVVITIIAILVSLTLAAGTKVVSVGRERGTQWALQALDNSVGEYIQANGSIPPAWVKDPLDATGNRRVPIIDGIVKDGDLRAMDSTAWYVHQLQAEGSSALAAVHQIDPKLRLTGISTTNILSNATSTGQRTTRILDVWGNPIRYVHPRFAGAHGTAGTGATELVSDVLPISGSATYKFTDFFRDGKTHWVAQADGSYKRADESDIKEKTSRASSDGGGSPNRRPYFYSAGPDGDPGTIDDNVYTIRPNFPR